MQVRKVAEENGVDVSGQIRELEDRAKQVIGSLVHTVHLCDLALIKDFRYSPPCSAVT